jgi:hypothetical protein
VKPLTIVLPDLEGTGPILDVQLGNSPTGQRALRQHGQTVPAPILVRALIDTGSDMCALDAGLAATLRLSLIGMQFLSGGFAGGSAALTAVPEYSAAIAFSHGVVLDITANEVPLPGGLQLLIGRDLLAKAHFAYDGLGNSFTLTV